MVNYDVNLGRGVFGVSGVLMDYGTGMVQLRIVAIFIAFWVYSPNESEVTVGLGYAKRAIMPPINWQI